MLTFFLFLQANFKQSRVIIQEIMRTMLRTPLFLIIQHPSQSQLLNIQIPIVYIQTKKMSKQDFAYTLKILIIGNSGVGKSCLLMRFSENKFQSNLLNTIGVDFKTKIVESEGQKVKLVLWDTAGQDRFRTITNSYYRNANGVIIVYDITDRTSFENVITWYDEINKNVDQKIGCFFVGNKLDMSAKRVVSFEEGNALATKYKVPFMETSAKNSHNVNELFQNLTRQMISLNSGPKPTHKRPPMPIKSSDKEEEMCRCCEN